MDGDSEAEQHMANMAIRSHEESTVWGLLDRPDFAASGSSTGEGDTYEGHDDGKRSEDGSDLLDDENIADVPS